MADEMHYSSVMASRKHKSSGDDTGYLEGSMLIAMPTMGDQRFERSVVFLCAHSPEGAMGIVVNKLISGISFPDLLGQLDIEAEGEDAPEMDGFHVHYGGPVETARGFVLHSPDYHSETSSMPIGETVSLTATVDILTALASGDGPEHALLALGYAGWDAGQLENEIQANGWLHCSADHALLFGNGVEKKYQRALSKIGVDPSLLSGEAGHA